MARGKARSAQTGSAPPLGDVRRFCDAYDEHRSEPASKWARLTPFTWCNVLDEEEMADLVADIERLLSTATTSQGVDELRHCLSIWQDWADFYRAPAYRRAMHEEIRAAQRENRRRAALSQVRG
jgi:thiaminase